MHHDPTYLLQNEGKRRTTICFDNKADVSIHQLQEILPRDCYTRLSVFVREDLVDNEEALRGDCIKLAWLDSASGDALRAESRVVCCCISTHGLSGFLFESRQGRLESCDAALPLPASGPI